MSKYSGEQMGLWKKHRIILLQVREEGERDERRRGEKKEEHERGYERGIKQT